MKKSLFIDVIALLFVLLFIYAAVSKIIEFNNSHIRISVDDFRVAISKSPILTPFAGTIAWLIPALEIGISVMLCVPKYQLSGLYASFSLMILFTAYIVIITQFTEYIPCSCGGILQKMSWNTHLIFNGIFDILGIIGILLKSESLPVLKNKSFAL